MEKKVLVETSARHVHVTREALDILFGEGYELTVKKELSQPGQFASNERVAVVGPKGSFPAVSILGPVRPENQVELSLTDARSIGVTAPVRESGDIAGSGACKLVGPKGEIETHPRNSRGCRKIRSSGQADSQRQDRLQRPFARFRRCRRQSQPEVRAGNAHRYR